MQFLLKLIFGSKFERDVKKLRSFVDKINSLEKDLVSIDDASLKGKTNEFIERIERGESLDSILPETFAIVRAASERAIGLRHFDVQLMGGIVLHQGKIAEMKTGEGKTLTSTLAIYLNALMRKGVHVVTVNDYLAKRDAEWMSPIYKFLGLSCGFITSNMEHSERQKAYSSDITYGTNNEFGFDYLRDNMVEHASLKVQRGHRYAIVDEVDSILIDEARTPLIISGPAEENTEIYGRIDKIIPSLNDKDDYEVDEKAHNVLLTELGVAKVEKLLQVDNLYDPKHVDLVHHVHQALKAHTLFQKEVDYVINNNEVVIVDEFTGRLMEGRRYSDGLHQAIEAKERVAIRQETQTLASITFQNYFRMYDKLAGMTGTADTEAEEFKKIYDLDVVVLPTHRKMIRIDHPDKIYRTQQEKFEAIADDVKDRHLKGQPVLVGTVSIENSEKIAKLLTQRGVSHSVLNAKYHAQEAEIILKAGQRKRVTIATNMAGRGTDIVLGDGVREVGGLTVIGSERHESRRIDNQLRGRSGRQGDTGESRFYLSLEDDLMRVFGSDRIGPIMQKLGMEEGEAIEHKMVTNAIERAQKRVEGHNFDRRKYLLEYDDVMNKQRIYIYQLRDKILTSKEIHRLIIDHIEEVIQIRLEEFFPSKNAASWNTSGFKQWLKNSFDAEIDDPQENLIDRGKNEILENTQILLNKKYEDKRKSMGEENFSLIERIISLQVIDQKWKDHLYVVDHLREGIWTLGYAEKNPLVEYRFQSFALFKEMNLSFKEEILEFLFRAQIEGPIKEDIPGDHQVRGEAFHSDIESYGVSAALNSSPQSASELASFRRESSGFSKAAQKTGGGTSKRKGRRRNKRK